MRHTRLTDIIAPSVPNTLFCLVVTLLLWYDIWLPFSSEGLAQGMEITGKSPLADLVEGLFSNAVWQGKILNLLMFLLNGLLLLRLNEVFMFNKVRTILPSFFFLITGSLLLPHPFTSVTIVVFFIVLALFSIFKLIIYGDPIYSFNTSMLIGIAALFSFSCIWFILPFWLFTMTNTFPVKVWLASLLGLLTPVLFAVIGFGLTGQENLLLLYVSENFKIGQVGFRFSIPEISYLILLGLLTLFSLFHFISGYGRENVKPKQEFTCIILFFIITLALFLFAVPDAAYLFGVLIVSITLIIGRFFSLENSLFSKILEAVYFVGSALFLFYNL